MTLEQRVRAIEDAQEIMQLKAQYCNAADCGWHRSANDADTIASLFAEDGLWDCGSYGRAKGREAIRASFKAMDNTFKLDFHLLGTPVIKVDGDTASGEWHGFFPVIVEGQAAWLGGIYNDEFVRTPEGWKFKKLKLTGAFSGKNEQGFAVMRDAAAH